MKKKTVARLIRECPNIRDKIAIASFGKLPSTLELYVSTYLEVLNAARVAPDERNQKGVPDVKTTFEEAEFAKLEGLERIAAKLGINWPSLRPISGEILIVRNYWPFMLLAARELLEFCLNSIRERNAGALRSLADVLSDYGPPGRRQVDQTRADILNHHLRLGEYGADLTAQEWASRVEHTGDMTVFRRLLSELDVPYAKQKGGRPKTQTAKAKTRKSKS